MDKSDLEMIGKGVGIKSLKLNKALNEIKP